MKSMSVVTLISILSCICLVRAVSDERVSGANQSGPDTDEIGPSKRANGLEVDVENFLLTRAEVENHEITGIDLLHATELATTATNSSARSFQKQIVPATSDKDDISVTVSDNIDPFADDFTTEVGSLTVEPLNHTPLVEASAQDKLKKDEADRDPNPDMNSLENFPINTVSMVNHSEPEIDKLGSGESDREDRKFDENNHLDTESGVEKPNDTGVRLDDKTEDIKSVIINSSTRSFQNQILSSKTEDDFTGIVTVGAFADGLASEDRSFVAKPPSHIPLDIALVKDTLDQDEGGHDHKQDMNSKLNPPLDTGNIKENEKYRFLKSSNNTDDAKSIDVTFKKNVFELMNSVTSFTKSDNGIMASELNIESDNIPEEVGNIPINGREGNLPMSMKINQTLSIIVTDDRFEDHTRSGKVTTTTLDPIAAILEEVEIVDASEYLPKGYVIKPEYAVDKELPVEKKNINELLAVEDDKNDIRFKPGKLYGKKLAAIAKEMKEAQLHYPNDDKIAKHNKDDLESTGSVRGGRKLSDGVEFSAEQDSLTTTTTLVTTTAVNPTTTSTPRPTTPSVCGIFCNLAGTLFIRSGLQWTEELAYSFTEEYKEVTKHIVREVSRIFDHVYFGNSFEFATVEAYSRRDGMVLVDIYVQFSDIVFEITTKDVKEAFVDRLVQDDNKDMMGEYELDTTWTYFSVIDTTIPETPLTLTNDAMGIFLPEWSLLAIVVGVISLFVIGFLGVIVCVNRQRNNQLLKKHVLNPRTLQLFKSKRHFDTVEVDDATAYANDKRDMWTLQKANQHKRSKTSLAMRPSYVDSGHGSGSGIYSFIPAHIRESFGKSGRKLYEKFPHNRIRSSSVRNHNDSGAGLLGGFDNTRLNSSGVIQENIVDTSFGEEQVGGGGNSQRTRSVDADQWDIVRVRGDQGMYFNDSDSSDAVSDGPSEKL